VRAPKERTKKTKKKGKKSKERKEKKEEGAERRTGKEMKPKRRRNGGKKNS
jgi:hypothetical protein